MESAGVRYLRTSYWRICPKSNEWDFCRENQETAFKEKAT